MGGGGGGGAAIALSSLLSKIFDNCISKQHDSFFNDLQFAYKSKTSTIHCTCSNFETANYYVSKARATCMHVLPKILSYFIHILSNYLLSFCCP